MIGRVVIWLLLVMAIFSLGYLTTDIVYKNVMAGVSENK
jgi:hypothetical protein